MKSVSLASALCLAVLATPMKAQAECQYVRGGITETRISATGEPGRNLGNVTGVLNGASTVVVTQSTPPVTSLDIFVTKGGDMLVATGFPTRTPIPGAPPGEFTVHVDLTITGGYGKYEAATGTLTFDGQSHNALSGPGVANADLIYQGTVCGPNIKGNLN